MAPIESFDIASSVHKSSPHALYARLRDNRPVCRVRLPTGEEAWLLARYNDVSAHLKDARFVKDAANAMTPEQLSKVRRPPKFLAPLTQNMLALDDPGHARLKKLVQAGFTPRRMDALAGRAEEIADQLLARLKGKPRFDLIADFALPLPVTIISELLGVPERDRDRFARWSHTLLSIPLSSWRAVFSLPDVIRFLRYLKKLVAMKRRTPGDDLVSALVAIESGSDLLNENELMAMIAILLSAGHETTTNLVGNGMLALMQNPDVRDQLRSSPPLIATGIEELLRFAGPVETTTPRYAREDVEVEGVTIPRGSTVLGLINSANFDEQQFENPHTINLSRTPNRHLTFGEGGHYCVGAALARMEGRVAFGALLARMPNLRLDRPIETLRWRPGLVLRGLEALPVRF